MIAIFKRNSLKMFFYAIFLLINLDYTHSLLNNSDFKEISLQNIMYKIENSNNYDFCIIKGDLNVLISCNNQKQTSLILESKSFLSFSTLSL